MSETKAQLAERLVAAWDAMERWKAEAMAARELLQAGVYEQFIPAYLAAEAKIYAAARAANGEE